MFSNTGKEQENENKIINIFLVLILLCGIGVLSYPFISNILQDRKQDQILTEYNEEMEKLSDAEIEEAKEKAKQYNDSLSNTVVISDPFDPDAADDMSADYISALNLEKNGIMAYIEIPRIDVYEPVYHGTSEEVLAKGVGHLEGHLFQLVERVRIQYFRAYRTSGSGNIYEAGICKRRGYFSYSCAE